jgi:hypothetical protein
MLINVGGHCTRNYILGGKRMGFIVFLLIVAGIIVLITVVKKIKRNATIKEAIEELTQGKSSFSYANALKIKEALEAKGGKFKEPWLHTNWKYDHQAEAMFFMSIPPSEKTCLRIYVSEYDFPLYQHKEQLLEKAKGCFFHNTTILVSSGEYGDTEDNASYDSNMLEYMKLASSLLDGYSEWYIEGERVDAP